MVLWRIRENFPRIIFKYSSLNKSFKYCKLQTAWNIKSYFLGKKKKNIINLSSAEFVDGVVKVGLPKLTGEFEPFEL